MSSAVIPNLLLAILLNADKVISTTLMTSESTSTENLHNSNFSDITGNSSLVPKDETTPDDSQGPLRVCPNTSCAGRCGDEPDPYRHFSCSCDIRCALFRDCCLDFHSQCGNSSLMTISNPPLANCTGPMKSCVTCVDRKEFHFHPLYMVTICPDGYKNSFIVDRCEDITNPLVLLHLPAYQNISGYMYRNVYCAICHGVNVTKIKTFLNEIFCPFNESESKDHLQGVPMSEQNFTEIYAYHCKLEIIAPDYVDYPERECIPVVLESCPRTGILQDYCQQYFEPVRVVLNPGEIDLETITARNKYCAKCSEYAEKPNYCWTRRFTGGGIFTDGLRFSVLFDFSSDIRIPKESNAPTATKIPLPPEYEQVTFTNYIFDFIIEIPSNITMGQIRRTVSQRMDTESIFISDCSGAVPNKSSMTHFYIINGTMSTTDMLSDNLIEKVDSFVIDTSDTYTVLYGVVRNTLCSLDTVCIAPINYYDNDTFRKLVGDSHTNSSINNVSMAVNFPLEVIWEKQGKQSMSSPCVSIDNGSVTRKGQTPVIGVCGDVLESNCNLVAYDIDDLLNTSESYNLSQLHMDFQYQLNSVIAVCKDKAVRDVATPRNSRRSQIEFYVTVIGCTLSILGLLFTIGTYCTFNELRNLAGKCILNLVGSMLAAQSLFIIGGVVAWQDEVSCQMVAVLQHLLWLATFSWTNILAYDLARTFSGKASVPRAHKSNKRFLVYCCIAWVVPIAIVAISVGLNYSAVIHVDYGKYGICWIRDRSALLGAFIAPVSVHIIFNIAAFSYTVYHIRKITQLAADMNVTSERRSQLSVYVRITAIMGFTWIIGYLSNLWSIEALWVIFAAFNSLQGFLIFVAFVLTSKVLRLYRKRFIGDRPNRGTVCLSSITTSSSNLLPASSTAL